MSAVAVVVLAACSVVSDRSALQPPAAPTDGPLAVGGLGLTVSADGRHFVDEAGEPFLWLADTAWSMPIRLDRDEVVTYLDARAGQGFNVVQTVAIFNQAGGPGPNRYGDSPYSGDLMSLAVTEGPDPGDPAQYDYWDHLDFIVAEAASRGMRVALVPIWGDDQAGTVVTEDNAADYGAFLGARYADDQVIWVMGGDATPDGVEDVWRELARGVAVGAAGKEDYSTTLMTYHPIGDRSSAEWFHDDPWLDFNMVQGGHCLRYDVRRDIIDKTFVATPAKPFLDGEPIYSVHPYCWDGPPEGYSTPLDVRRDAYWSAFAGAAGHTYGHHSVWQFLGTGQPATLGAQGDWRSALDDEAGGQLRHLATLMEARKWWTLVPDQAIVTSDIGSGLSRLQATRAANGAYAMVYNPAGVGFEVDVSVLTGDTVRLSWFDPRTGETIDVGTARAGTAAFTPPSADDWVLIVDAHG